MTNTLIEVSSKSTNKGLVFPNAGDPTPQHILHATEAAEDIAATHLAEVESVLVWFFQRKLSRNLNIQFFVSVLHEGKRKILFTTFGCEVGWVPSASQMSYLTLDKLKDALLNTSGDWTMPKFLIECDETFAESGAPVPEDYKKEVNVVLDAFLTDPLVEFSSIHISFTERSERMICFAVEASSGQYKTEKKFSFHPKRSQRTGDLIANDILRAITSEARIAEEEAKAKKIAP